MKKNIINTLRNLKDGEGLTLKDWNIITYKTGWQVADNGVETPELLNAYMAIASYHGTCGVWLENGTYYLKEVEAPSGYSLSNDIYEIKVNASDENGRQVW